MRGWKCVLWLFAVVLVSAISIGLFVETIRADESSYAEPPIWPLVDSVWIDAVPSAGRRTTLPTPGEHEFYPSTSPTNGINTNWSYLGGGTWVAGGTDPDEREFAADETGFMCMITDDVAPSKNEIADYIEACETNYDHVHQRPDPFNINIYNHLNQVRRNGTWPNVQVACNHVRTNISLASLDRVAESVERAVPIGHGTFTMFFSEYFDSNSVEKNILIVQPCSWNVTPNEVFQSTSNPPHLHALFVHNSYAHHYNRGAVYLIYNSGGHGCLGINENNREDMSEMIKLMCTRFNCDQDRVVFMGASRAGVSALMSALNIDREYDYKPAALAVSGLPLSIGNMARTAVGVHAELCNAYYVLFMDHEAHRYTSDNPPASDPSELIRWIMDTSDCAEANDNSPDWQEAYFDNLLHAAPLICKFSTKDGFQRYDANLAFEQKLARNGVKVCSFHMLRKGHMTDGGTTPFDALIGELVNRLLDDPDYDPTSFSPSSVANVKCSSGTGPAEAGRNYYLRLEYWDYLAASGGTYEHLDSQNELPFSAIFPHYIGAHVLDGMEEEEFEPGEIYIMGAAGRAWEVNIDAEGSYGGTPFDQQIAHFEGDFGSDLATDPWGESYCIKWSYEGIPVTDGFTEPPNYPNSVLTYRFQFLYENETGQMVDVSEWTNFANEEGDPGSGHKPAEIEMRYNQPPAYQYYVYHGTSNKTIFGIDWLSGIEDYEPTDESTALIVVPDTLIEP